MTPEAPRQFSIVLRAAPGVADPARALKAVLKHAGRVHGLKGLLLAPEPHRQAPDHQPGLAEVSNRSCDRCDNLIERRPRR